MLEGLQAFCAPDLDIQQGHVRHEVHPVLAVCSMSHSAIQPQYSISCPQIDGRYGHGIGDIGMPLGPGPTAFLHDADRQGLACGIQIGPLRSAPDPARAAQTAMRQLDMGRGSAS